MTPGGTLLRDHRTRPTMGSWCRIAGRRRTYSSRSRSAAGGSGTSRMIGRVHDCSQPALGWTRGNRGGRSKRAAAYQDCSGLDEVAIPHRTFDVGAASTRVVRWRCSNRRGRRGRRLLSSAPSRYGEGSWSTNADGARNSHIPPGSGWSARCACGSSPGRGSLSSSTPSPDVCTPCVRSTGAGSSSPMDVALAGRASIRKPCKTGC
jgi:hypothetical protein